ncbi:hypothetical protein [Hymenobacter perfusus]|uniref:Uncharacterized protein n=1 Tax=Hymenobacter perfusus TaxID=1236770 RepID=A0A3R9P593_9BACT|nr:hypothetical protein [Hymenobacter perfusus]RSK44574.1 hypothetical protein EI293_08650 [Hymenobacter perfusus]
MMKYKADLTAINWLEIGEQPVIKGGLFRVANALPDVFEAYIALLPAIGLIEGFPFDQISLKDNSIAQTNQNAAIWGEYGIHDAHRTPDYKPTVFRELANQFKLPFDVTLLSRLDWGKRGFAIDWTRTANSLKALLNALATGNDLSLYIEDYWRWAEIHEILPTTDEVLYEVNAEDFLGFMTQSFFDATLYLFPEDRSWCLVNIEDCNVMIIGTDRATAAMIAKTYSLETIDLLYESPM